MKYTWISCEGTTKSRMTLSKVKYRQSSFYCALLYGASQVLRFLQSEGQTLYQQKIATRFIVALT